MLRLCSLLLVLLLLNSACNPAEDTDELDLASPLEGTYRGTVELYAPNVSYELYAQQQLEITRLSNSRIAIEPINSSQVEPFTATIQRSATGLTLVVASFQTANGIQVQGSAVDSSQMSIHGRYENNTRTFRYALDFNNGALREYFEGTRLD